TGAVTPDGTSASASARASPSRSCIWRETAAPSRRPASTKATTRAGRHCSSGSEARFARCASRRTPSGTYASRPESVQAFDDHGHALTAADAHRLEPDRLARVLEPVQQRRHDAGTRLTERGTQHDHAALHVQRVPLDTKVAVGTELLGR